MLLDLPYKRTNGLGFIERCLVRWDSVSRGCDGRCLIGVHVLAVLFSSTTSKAGSPTSQTYMGFLLYSVAGLAGEWVSGPRWQMRSQLSNFVSILAR
jgi:hypothetical protein